MLVVLVDEDYSRYSGGVGGVGELVLLVVVG
jgi:hypothetical protein